MKLMVVLGMLNGCFNPTKDQCTKIDILSYGRKVAEVPFISTLLAYQKQ